MGNLANLNKCCAALKSFAMGTQLNVIITAVRELMDDHATLKALVDDIKARYNNLADIFGVNAAGCVLWNIPTLSLGSTPQNVATTAFYYLIQGKLYLKAAVAAGTAPGNDVVPQNKYGAVAFDIGADGTIDAVEATGNATGYDDASSAVIGLPAVASNHVRLGYITAIKTDGDFTFGTTALNAANSTVTYNSSPTGLADTLSTQVSAGTVATLAATQPAVIT